jgi:hypothetical protein
MPPLAQPTGLAHINDSKRHCISEHLVQPIFSLLILGTIAWSVKHRLWPRKKAMSQSPPSVQEKGSTDPGSPTMDTGVESKPTQSPSGKWEKEHRSRLDSLGQELQQDTLKPIYPWTAPPQALPGPYDHPYYPLPTPTVRRHSIDPENAPPDESHTVSHFRRISSTGLPPRDTVLHTSTTASTRGWRRTQWVVMGG